MREISTLVMVALFCALCSCKSINNVDVHTRSQVVKRPLALLGNTAQYSPGLGTLNSQNQYLNQVLFNPYNAEEIAPGPIGGIMSGPNGIQGAIGASQGKLYKVGSNAGVVAGSNLGDRRWMINVPQVQTPGMVGSHTAGLGLQSKNEIDPSDDKKIMGDPNLFNKKCTVLRLKFELNDGDQVYDSSEQRNEVFLKDGAGLTDKGVISGKAVNLGNDGKIYIGSKFKGKPRKSMGLSLWVKLENIQGNHSLFRATDLNNFVHYELLSSDGKVSWVHHGDDGKELFRVQSDAPVLGARKWQHIVSVYNYQSKKASLWLDGRKIKEKNGIQGQLAQRWSLLSVFGGRTKGLMDNIQLFRCPLDRTKVVALYVATASPKEDKKSLVEKPHKTSSKHKKSKIRLSEKLKNF